MLGRAILIGVLPALTVPAAPQSLEPMPHASYVWQRAWTDSVIDAVTTDGTNFAKLVALNAEVNWKQGVPRVARVQLDARALERTGRPIGLALRIGAFSGPFHADDGPARFLAELAATLLAAAATNHLSVAELQIDFDCAESKLDGYVTWVEAMRREVTPVPVVITALPAWLKQPAFKRLIAVADGYVLQVHSLERPKSIQASFTLCDPVKARRAVGQAGQFGRPFWVALPTYGYLMAFDQSGHYLGVSAEGPALSWPEGVQVREVCADPAAMADLVRAWNGARPRTMQGVIWYRLPVAGEHLNWHWPTLAAVMGGTAPRADVQGQARHPTPALVEIDLVNKGAADGPLPPQVTVQWHDAQLLAADGLQGFETAETGPHSFRFQSRDGGSRLRAGERRNIGWVRFTKETEVKIELSKEQRK